MISNIFIAYDINNITDTINVTNAIIVIINRHKE